MMTTIIGRLKVQQLCTKCLILSCKVFPRKRRILHHVNRKTWYICMYVCSLNLKRKPINSIIILFFVTLTVSIYLCFLCCHVIYPCQCFEGQMCLSECQLTDDDIDWYLKLTGNSCSLWFVCLVSFIYCSSLFKIPF